MSILKKLNPHKKLKLEAIYDAQKISKNEVIEFLKRKNIATKRA